MLNSNEIQYLISNLIPRKKLLEDNMEKRANDLYWHIKCGMEEDKIHCETLMKEYKRELEIIESILNEFENQ